MKNLITMAGLVETIPMTREPSLLLAFFTVVFRTESRARISPGWTSSEAEYNSATSAQPPPVSTHVPSMERREDGEEVPIPTRPLESIIRAGTELVAKVVSEDVAM